MLITVHQPRRQSWHFHSLITSRYSRLPVRVWSILRGPITVQMTKEDVEQSRRSSGASYILGTWRAPVHRLLHCPAADGGCKRQFSHRDDSVPAATLICSGRYDQVLLPSLLCLSFRRYWRRTCSQLRIRLTFLSKLQSYRLLTNPPKYTYITTLQALIPTHFAISVSSTFTFFD